MSLRTGLIVTRGHKMEAARRWLRRRKSYKPKTPKTGRYVKIADPEGSIPFGVIRIGEASATRPLLSLKTTVKLLSKSFLEELWLFLRVVFPLQIARK